MKYIVKGLIKYAVLFVVACVGAIAIYYYVVPEGERTPIGIEIGK